MHFCYESNQQASVALSESTTLTLVKMTDTFHIMITHLSIYAHLVLQIIVLDLLLEQSLIC